MGYAEPMLPGISNILFGRSQVKVDKLSRTNRLSVPNVLDAIWEHMEQLTTRQHNEKMSGRSVQSSVHYSQTQQTSCHKTLVGSNIIAPMSNLKLNKTPPQSRSGSPIKSPLPTDKRQRSPSPTRRRAFKCSFCETNEHSHLDCSKFSPDQMLKLCKERYLCFVCRTWGHGANYCPFTSLQCTKSSCKNVPPHCTILCDVLKPY